MEIGRVKGHRGTGGEMTVLIHDGEAVDWATLERIWLSRPGAEPEAYAIATRSWEAPEASGGGGGRCHSK